MSISTRTRYESGVEGVGGRIEGVLRLHSPRLDPQLCSEMEGLGVRWEVLECHDLVMSTLNAPGTGSIVCGTHSSLAAGSTRKVPVDRSYF